MLFTNESRFSLRFPVGRERIWRREEKSVSPCTFSSHVSLQGGSVMVWGGISYKAHIELVFINGGALTTQRYIEEPLIGEDFLLVQDNAHLHVAIIMDELLHDLD